jgi:hypothetical protein
MVVLRKRAIHWYHKKYGQHLIFHYPKRTWYYTWIFIFLLSFSSGIRRAYFADTSQTHLFPFLAGFVLTIAACAIAGYLAALLIYRHVYKHPDDIQGLVDMRADLVHRLAVAISIPPLLIFVPLAIVVCTPLTVGCASGALMMILMKLCKEDLEPLF